MDFIIGTAGHIDHGKTELIKALTGIDSHHHKEEKMRGITIDIGYAWLKAPDGNKIGIIDVPGHERFIHNMLAGVTGIDMVLFTIAADDGIMPQTREHFDILKLLKLSRGIFAITKIDRVSASRVEEIKKEITEFIKGSLFENSPIMPVSAITGQGIPELKEHLFKELDKIPAHLDNTFFRLPVDRVFSVPGFGTVVTGTVVSGNISVNDKIKLLPSGKSTRIRGMQKHGEPVSHARSGQRLALNITDISVESISRGEVVCHPFYQKITNRFDAWIEILPSIPGMLKSHSRIHFHAWTSEDMGEIILLDTETLKPGDSAFCQVVLRSPVHLLKGDRFIFRDETASYTIGGGEVLDAFAPRHKMNDKKIIPNLQILRESAPLKMATLLCQNNPYTGITLNNLNERLNLYLKPEQFESADFKILSSQEDILIFTAIHWAHLKDKICNELQTYHKENPSSPGQEIEAFRKRFPAELPFRIFRILIDELVGQKLILLKENILSSSTHVLSFSPEEEKIKEEIFKLYHQRLTDPPRPMEVPALLNRDSKNVIKVFKILLQLKDIIKLNDDVYLTRTDLKTMILKIIEYGKKNPAFKISDIRDLLGSSRKIVVPLMEYLDRAEITLRKGDIRVIKLSIKPMKHSK
jgi:selenocysteine-specific elongation factor